MPLPLTRGVVAAHDRKPTGSETDDDQGLLEQHKTAVRIESDDLLARMRWVRLAYRRVVERSQRLVTGSIILLA